MRIREILKEYKTSPSTLTKLSSGIDAIVGMEFEMIVPNTNEPLHLRNDVEFGSFKDVFKYFPNTNYREQLKNDYLEFLLHDAENEWKSSEDHDLDKNSFIEMSVKDNYNTKIDQERFLEHNGITWASEFCKKYNFNMDDDPEKSSIEQIGTEFQKSIGKPVLTSRLYHSGIRKNNSYTLEPDDTITTENEKDAGIEFISPPMNVQDMLTDLTNVISWAKNFGCYTNDSTGLHINVSIKGKDMKNLDYLKLAILLGDEYLLNQFERLTNDNCNSSYQAIVDKLQKNPDMAQTLLNASKSNFDYHLNIYGSQCFKQFNKYVSINVKPEYVEFRSPGGNWLNKDLGKLISTMMRCIVALDAALDPAKYRKEYLKKIRSLFLNFANGNVEFENYSKFLLGELSKSQLQTIWLKQNPKLFKKVVDK